MRVCIITGNKKSYASKRLVEEFSLQKVKPFLFDREDISLNSRGIFIGNTSLKKFDIIIVRASNSLTPLSLILDFCSFHNLKLLNKSFYSKYSSTNKLRQQVIFQDKKLPCLKTIYGERQTYSTLKKELGHPFVAKLSKGSLGQQVFKITSRQSFDDFLKKRQFDKETYLFQKFYQTKGDYRVFIIGKEVFGPVKRIAKKGEWRTNIPGAIHERAENKKNVLQLAKKFADATGIEFAGIDILIDSSGKPRIIEVNTMADFRVFDKIYPEVNIAKKTIRLLLDNSTTIS